MNDLDPSNLMAVRLASLEQFVLDETAADVALRLYLTEQELVRAQGALAASQEDVARLSAYSVAAFDQRDAAQDALAGSEAKVARVQSLADQWRAADLVRVSQIDTALADQPERAS